MNPEPIVIPSSTADAGEILTLQRAAYVTEAQAHDDPHLPPLRQTLSELVRELGRADVLAFGIRERGRLVGAGRITLDVPLAHLGRLAVAPDRQGQGLGSALLRAAESLVPEPITEIRLFTGEHSHANLRLYEHFGYREFQRTPAGGYQLVHLAKTLC